MAYRNGAIFYLDNIEIKSSDTYLLVKAIFIVVPKLTPNPAQN